MNNILIFGTFNPITKAHLNLGELAKQRYPDSKVIFIPCANEFIENKIGKENNIFCNLDRINMLCVATDKIEDFKISFIEMNHTVSGFTYDSIKQFENPIIVIGADKLCELDTWFLSEKLVKENKFLVVTRDNNKGQLSESLKQYEDHFEYMEGTYQNISSTIIREAFKNNNLENIKEYVSKEVYNYLKWRMKHELF